MKVKQAVKHLSLLSIMLVGVSACSLSLDATEQITLSPSMESANEETIVKETMTKTVVNNGAINIPTLADAKVFAEFTDFLPAVINYFTDASEVQVIEFYQQEFGVACSQERKRGQLTLNYAEGEEVVRVVISQQNKKRQVDIIVESKK
ncbi:MAG: hypothetical protein GY928_40555 [Colwellia sp.]|nr:hypothetical protein [Colwellia sp.]